MKNIRSLFAKAVLATALVFSLGMAVPALAAPSDVFNKKACNGNTTVCPSSSDDGLFKIARNIINVILTAAGIISVIVIIIGGISYTVSSGDQAKVKKAKDTILYAVIGLAVSIMSFAIVNFVLTRL